MHVALCDRWLNSALELWLSRWLAVSPLALLSLFTLFFQRCVVTTIAQPAPLKKKKKKKKSLQSRASRWPHCTPVRNANTYSVLTCKCLQTHKHTHSSSQQAACSVWVSYCTGCLTHRRQTVLLIGAELGSQTLTYWTDWPECSPGQPQIAGPCQPFIRLSKAPLYVAPLWRSCCSSELVLCSGKKIPRRCWGDESFFKALGVRGNSTTD